MVKRVSFFLLLLFSVLPANLRAAVEVVKLNPTTVEVHLDGGRQLTLDFYGPNIVRLFMDPQGGILRNPEATPPAKILVDQPRRAVGTLTIEENNVAVSVTTPQMIVTVLRSDGRLDFWDRRSGKRVTGQTSTPITFDEKGRTVFSLTSEGAGEAFYGGGVQNGRFSHRGNIIAIENTNNWVDGGVASPTPFYWSTAGYGILWHTFAPGKYDFGATTPNVVTLMHETPYLDLFLMLDDGAVALLNDFYQLTGHPVLLPKFGFYEGHLNAYNRDYWKEVGSGESSPNGAMFGSKGILFESGKQYKEEQKPNGGIRESLNGELEGNYPFSARAVIDRYERADMPLGWVLPNDGYGAGYGQTGTLEGNVENLRLFGEYARKKGVEIGLWTQSDLHPKEGVEALLQRDIVREVRDAGVRVLKTDVAWVGAGYSFGLNGVADVGEIMPYYGNDARPFIISLDGWAGTQRYAGIWTGDQTGGEWEYIRFHIPTYIGSGLSGQPNISSDMDGIFGGRNIPVNVRDFQWKTFSPMQLNMDGWGSNPKYPQALGEPATSINRRYLKLKSELMPYTYTIAHEAIDGLPMLRAMFLADDNDYTRGIATRYQFLYGPDILVAPIYQNTAADAEGNDVRHNIYLPKGQWIDWFTGECYEGGRIINGFPAPLWKLPVFVRRGAIIPMTAPHNNPSQMDRQMRQYLIYPLGCTEFTTYDDDGRTQAYLNGKSATTHIVSNLDAKGRLTVTVEPTKGTFSGMEQRQKTTFVIALSAQPRKIVLKANGKKIEFQSTAEYLEGKNEGFCKLRIATREAYDVASTKLQLVLDGYTFDTASPLLRQTGPLGQPTLLTDDYEDGAISPSAYTLPLRWTEVPGADYYEIEHLGQIFSTIPTTSFTLEDLQPETNYEVRVRAINKEGQGEWTREKFRTSPDPLRFAIHGITAETTCDNQPGQGIAHFFDFDEGTTWHTAWSQQAVPFDIVIDLHVVAQLDQLQYVPRNDAGNGTLLSGTVAYSMDRQTWSEPVAFNWAASGQTKTFSFAPADGHDAPVARYLRLHVDEARGQFGSGQQLYVFRVPGSETYIPGDINHDNRLDENDLTSYMNYTGLRRGDGDFEGYISRGDLNQNGLIDAYDISAVGIELESGVSSRRVASVSGTVTVTADKSQVNAGDIVTLTVRGQSLVSVNAISFALPYDAAKWEYLGIDPVGTLEMRNLTYDRLHTNGQKALYPTFVNCGEHPYAEGDATLMTIRFRARQKTRTDLRPQDGMILDKYMNVISW